jgi:hypothetical protein
MAELNGNVRFRCNTGCISRLRKPSYERTGSVQWLMPRKKWTFAFKPRLNVTVLDVDIAPTDPFPLCLPKSTQRSEPMKLSNADHDAIDAYLNAVLDAYKDGRIDLLKRGLIWHTPSLRLRSGTRAHSKRTFAFPSAKSGSSKAAATRGEKRIADCAFRSKR